MCPLRRFESKCGDVEDIESSQSQNELLDSSCAIVGNGHTASILTDISGQSLEVQIVKHNCKLGIAIDAVRFEPTHCIESSSGHEVGASISQYHSLKMRIRKVNRRATS